MHYEYINIPIGIMKHKKYSYNEVIRSDVQDGTIMESLSAGVCKMNSEYYDILIKQLDENIACIGDKEEFRKQRERTMEQRIRKAKEEEEQAFEQKLAIANKAFAWAEDFLKDDQLQSRLANQESVIQVHGTQIYGNVWGHDFTKTEHDRECWSRLFIMNQKKVMFYYWAGYKWMDTGPEWIITEPEEFARLLSIRYLHDLEKAIDSGSIYEAIMNHIGKVRPHA